MLQSGALKPNKLKKRSSIDGSGITKIDPIANKISFQKYNY